MISTGRAARAGLGEVEVDKIRAALAPPKPELRQAA
jgi:hypothetical protein